MQHQNQKTPIIESCIENEMKSQKSVQFFSLKPNHSPDNPLFQESFDQDQSKLSIINVTQKIMKAEQLMKLGLYDEASSIVQEVDHSDDLSLILNSILYWRIKIQLLACSDNKRSSFDQLLNIVGYYIDQSSLDYLILVENVNNICNPPMSVMSPISPIPQYDRNSVMSPPNSDSPCIELRLSLYSHRKYHHSTTENCPYEDDIYNGNCDFEAGSAPIIIQKNLFSPSYKKQTDDSYKYSISSDESMINDLSCINELLKNQTKI